MPRPCALLSRTTGQRNQPGRCRHRTLMLSSANGRNTNATVTSGLVNRSWSIDDRIIALKALNITDQCSTWMRVTSRLDPETEWGGTRRAGRPHPYPSDWRQ